MREQKYKPMTTGDPIAVQLVKQILIERRLNISDPKYYAKGWISRIQRAALDYRTPKAVEFMQNRIIEQTENGFRVSLSMKVPEIVVVLNQYVEELCSN